MKPACFLLLLLVACNATRKSTTNVAAAALVPDGKLFTSAFQQRAAEYKALCFQAYNLARARVDQLSQESLRPRAIITDIDETVLDNSAYAVQRGLEGKDWEQQSWYDWTRRAKADTVPGAPAFLKYAASKGLTIFYITNRDENERAATLRNLQRFQLPNADNEHLMPKQSGSSKETRRQQVMSHYDVVLLLGDNLADFSAFFDKKTTEERTAQAGRLAAEFGNRFIVLPNPNYGDWESALYQYNYGLKPPQKDSVIRASVHGY